MRMLKTSKDTFVLATWLSLLRMAVEWHPLVEWYLPVAAAQVSAHVASHIAAQTYGVSLTVGYQRVIAPVAMLWLARTLTGLVKGLKPKITRTESSRVTLSSGRGLALEGSLQRGVVGILPAPFFHWWLKRRLFQVFPTAVPV